MSAILLLVPGRAFLLGGFVGYRLRPVGRVLALARAAR
jgi:hypothetical protein